MNCPDCDAPMRQEDAPPDGEWPQVSYRCPVCYPEPDPSELALTEDDVIWHTARESENIDTGGRL